MANVGGDCLEYELNTCRCRTTNPGRCAPRSASSGHRCEEVGDAAHRADAPISVQGYTRPQSLVTAGHWRPRA
jgi:hypothetical protein